MIACCRQALRHAIPLLAAAGVIACRANGDPRVARDFERMRRQVKYSSYGSSAFFPNGAVMQPPPAHTVSREATLCSPACAPTATLETGARQYAISCAACHGVAGYGGGPLAPNLTERRPPSLRALGSTPDSAIVATIVTGRGAMPPLGWQLSPGLRLAVADYVKLLSSRPPTAASAADSAMADYLARLDSLHAAGAPIEAIARLHPPSS
jgi:mono/diheme cytochrome c family protein